MTATFRPRRSVLYMPSSNERALEKAKTIPCDGLILDLEDAVAPDAKPAAREARGWLMGGGRLPWRLIRRHFFLRLGRFGPFAFFFLGQGADV